MAFAHLNNAADHVTENVGKPNTRDFPSKSNTIFLHQ